MNSLSSIRLTYINKCTALVQVVVQSYYSRKCLKRLNKTEKYRSTREIDSWLEKKNKINTYNVRNHKNVYGSNLKKGCTCCTLAKNVIKLNG